MYSLNIDYLLCIYLINCCFCHGKKTCFCHGGLNHFNTALKGYPHGVTILLKLDI